MTKPTETATEIKLPERVTCPQCAGAGDIIKPTSTNPAISIRSPDVAFVEGKLRTEIAGREGWQKIAESLLTAAFGSDMRGFSTVPPHEMLDAVNLTDPSDAVVEALSSAIIGRAWRARGKDAIGVCDYPLCKNRGKHIALVKVGATFNAPKLLQDIDRPDLKRKDITINVCGDASECHAWAQWVAARAKAGTIQCR